MLVLGSYQVYIRGMLMARLGERVDPFNDKRRMDTAWQNTHELLVPFFKRKGLATSWNAMLVAFEKMERHVREQLLDKELLPLLLA